MEYRLKMTRLDDVRHPGGAKRQREAKRNARTEHSVLAASHIDDDDSDGHSDRKILGSDSNDEILGIMKIEYRFPSGEEACRPMSISFDRGLSCGYFWRHLRDCGVDMENTKLAVDTQVVDVYMKMALLTSVKEQLPATPGVLRITVVHTAPYSACATGSNHGCLFHFVSMLFPKLQLSSSVVKCSCS